MKFSITPEQDIKIDKWLHEEVYPKVIASQREHYKDPSPFITACWDEGYPYEGASGGGLTYSFTPTSLGTVEKVKYGDFELDVSNYGDW
jgi:hypothetical protein